jgi:unsaturated rhamnogalacturonyl hydrolase
MVKGETGPLERAVALADSVVRTVSPEMKWMWGQALLGYALTELDSYLGEDRYLSFTNAYCDHHARHTPRVDQSDTCAPALVTYALYKRTGDPRYKDLTDRVLSYIRSAPRLACGAVNHLGHSPEGRLYPRSVWVDSLMMFAVFPARYAAENRDPVLLDTAAAQPGLYARLLMDPETRLWHHAYWDRPKRPYPRRLFWGRGNGWVIASLPMILDHLPGDHPERSRILAILRETSEALLPYQRPDGYFETVLSRPGRTYRESSATALVASGWLQGVRTGYLPETFRAPAERAIAAVAGDLRTENGLTYMDEISGPTVPLQAFPYLGYKLIPRGTNRSYGVAAFIFAAIQHDRLLKIGRTGA